MTKPRATPPSQPGTAAQLLDEHGRLQAQCADISRRAATGNCRECDVVWVDFTWQLAAHLAFKARATFPRYKPQGAPHFRTVKALRAKYATIREALAELEMDLQLHLARAEMEEIVLTFLRIHARCERDSLYPWLPATDALA